MDRRMFLRGGAVGLGGAAVAAGTGVGGVLYEKAKDTRQQEHADFGGSGHGAARLVWSVATDQKVAALTFDDGPDPKFTPRVLDLLEQHRVHATFFVVGTEVQRHPDLVRRIVAAGHELGNHTWSHPHIAHFGAAAAQAEVRRGTEAIVACTGIHPRWFRSPRGMLTGPILQAASDQGQDIAMWSATTDLTSPKEPPEKIAAHLLDRLAPGAIFDLHDGTSGREGDHSLVVRREAELPAYPAFVGRAQARGYRFVTLTELVGLTKDGPLAGSPPPR